MKQSITRFLFPLFLFMLTAIPFSNAQFGNIKDKIKSHLEADPLTISGQLGGEMNLAWNNQRDNNYTDPFGLAAYANFDIGIYGFHIPVNINLLNLSMSQFSLPYPKFSINTTPQFGKLRLHLGTSSMHFNNYTYSGISFTGVGAEYSGQKFRAAGFYGIFNKETRMKKEDNRSMLQYWTDSLLGLNTQYGANPQFRRKAWGAKIGVGNTKNYVDLSVMKAIDDTSSLDAVWFTEDPETMKRDTTHRDSVIKAKENFAVGLSARFNPIKWLTVNGNFGATLYTEDLNANELGDTNNIIDLGDEVNDYLSKIPKGIYTVRTNSKVRLAGDAAVNLNFNKVTATFTTRMVQSDYTSLGANQFSQNIFGTGGNINFRLLKNRSFLSLTGYLQHDNIDKKQMYTNQVATYAANWTYNISDNINFTASYNGIKQDQRDGQKQVTDSIRTNQIMHSISLSPSYTIYGDNEHTISLNFNDVINKNLNEKLKTFNANDVSTITFGASYDMHVTAKRLNVGASYDYSSSSSSNNSYKSHTLGGSISYNAIKKKDMNLRLNGNLSFSYNIRPEDADDGYQGILDSSSLEIPTYSTNTTGEISFGTRIGASLNYKNSHHASFYLSTSNYSDNIVFGQRITTRFDLRMTLSYSYSFSSRIIKSKKETERLEKAKELD